MNTNPNTFDKFAVLSCSICERKFNQAEINPDSITNKEYCDDCFTEQRQTITNALDTLSETIDAIVARNSHKRFLWTSQQYGTIYAIVSDYVDAELRDKYAIARREAQKAYAIENALNLAIEHLQKVNGIDSGDNASVFFSGEKGDAITKIFAEYLDFEKLYSA